MSRNQARVQAVSQIVNRKPIDVTMPEPLSKIWASDVSICQRWKKHCLKTHLKH